MLLRALSKLFNRATATVFHGSVPSGTPSSRTTGRDIPDLPFQAAVHSSIQAVVGGSLLPLLLLFPLRLEAEPLPWRRLQFSLDTLLTVKAKLRLDLQSEVSRGTAPLYHLTIDTKLNWFLIDRAWHGDLWFRGKTAIKRVRTKLGRKGYRKVFRYGKEGVTRLRYRPGEEIPEEERFFPKPPDLPCREVGDPYALLFLLSRPRLPSQLCVFNKEEYYRLAFKPIGKGMVEVSYRDGSRKVEGSRPVQKILLVPEPIGQPQEAFEFLGMEGEILFWRDPESGLLYRIEGDVPRFGHAVIKLRRVVR